MYPPVAASKAVVLTGVTAGEKEPISCFDPRACPLDDDRFLDTRDLQDSRSLNSGAGADADIPFVIGRKPLELDVEHVPSWGESGKAELPSLVRGHSRRAANQRLRAHTNDRTGKDAALIVADSSDESSRQALPDSRPR